jgi:hypothetical protein
MPLGSAQTVLYMRPLKYAYHLNQLEVSMNTLTKLALGIFGRRERPAQTHCLSRFCR